MYRKELFSWGKTEISGVTPYAYQETLLLLSFVLQISPTELLAHSEYPVSDTQKHRFCQLIQRRCQGEPIPYLTGECEFWSLPFIITPQCLIPRPETEVLVEHILAAYPSKRTLQLADLGTGSGVIAIALAMERPHWQITATDQSTSALNIAQNNAKHLGTSTITFSQGNWFNALPLGKKWDVIVSNPPYIARDDPCLKENLRYEPSLALIGGAQGSEILHHLIRTAPTYLSPGGQLWLEQGYDQAEMIRTYLHQYGYKDTHQYPDLSGILRVSCGTIY